MRTSRQLAKRELAGLCRSSFLLCLYEWEGFVPVLMNDPGSMTFIQSAAGNRAAGAVGLPSPPVARAAGCSAESSSCTATENHLLLLIALSAQTGGGSADSRCFLL